MSKNIFANNNRIYGLPTPIANDEVSTKKYTDDDNKHKNWATDKESSKNTHAG